MSTYGTSDSECDAECWFLRWLSAAPRTYYGKSQPFLLWPLILYAIDESSCCQGERTHPNNFK